jgi:hypothetical protein
MLERILSEAGEHRLAQQAHFHLMGEPLLYPALLDAVTIARRHGMEAWITTNGSLLTPSLLAALCDADLSHLTISLQTPDEETFTLRGCSHWSFEEYRQRLIAAVQTFLSRDGSTRLTVGFLANPLRRFRAPNAPRMHVVESGSALRAHMRRWVEWIFDETPHAAAIPEIVARTRKAGILKECSISLTPRLDFQVRALGNWASHFVGPTARARFGYCPGLSENFGVLWNGDYVICCTDYDGQTALRNAKAVSVRDYLALPAVQEIASAFRRFRVVHPYCRRCLGDRHAASALCRQAGSILYFKLYRRLLDRRGLQQEAV